MRLMKKGCLLRSTEKGQIGWTAGFWIFLFWGILLCSLLQMEIFRSSAQYLEDALAASNLAAAIIDVEEYGVSHRIQIEDVYTARLRCIAAMKANLGLDANWECTNQSLISGPVHMVNFTVYNVDEENVEVYSFDENGVMYSGTGTLGSVRAPNGVMVESTGIYNEIVYRVKGFPGIETDAHKGKLVDIVMCE